MADRSGIQWTDATWNPTVGCSRVSEGCRHCYAERLAPRLGHEGIVHATPRGPEWTGKVLLFPERLEVPLRWRKPRRVFVDSVSDLFHPEVPDDFIDRVFTVMAAAPQHTFQVLTKRPERMADYLIALLRENGRLDKSLDRGVWWFPPSLAQRDAEALDKRFTEELNPFGNVWLGASVEDQATTDQRVPHLLRAPAAMRFLSCEPLLGPVDVRCAVRSFSDQQDEDGAPGPGTTDDGEGPAEWYVPQVGWVIVGGESGPASRPFDLAWARAIVHQCRAYGAAPFVKQLGAHPHDTHGPDERSRCRAARKCDAAADWRASAVLNDGHGGDPAEWPEDLRVREFPPRATAVQVPPGATA